MLLALLNRKHFVGLHGVKEIFYICLWVIIGMEKKLKEAKNGGEILKDLNFIKYVLIIINFNIF